MARADVASASAHADSIKGLAQSIAKPAYRRLLNAEPLLRRAVPVLIIAFLATICVGALVQVLDHRRQTLTIEIAALEALADIAAERLEQPLKQPASAVEQPQQVLARALPSWAMAAGRRFLLTNAYGIVTATNDVWRQCRRHGHCPARQYARAGHCAHAQGPIWPTSGYPVTGGSPRELALAHNAHCDFVGHHRVRCAYSGLCFSLAGDKGARGGPYPRNSPQPDRYCAQSGPLRTLGLGPGAGAHFLVAVDV